MTKLTTNSRCLNLMLLALKPQKDVIARSFPVLYRPSYDVRCKLQRNSYSMPLSTVGKKPQLCGCSSWKNGLTNKYLFYSPSATARHYTLTNENAEKKPSLYQRFKSMYRDYWYVLLPVHMVTSAAWFGGFYVLASSGVDIVSLMESLNLPDKVISPFRNGHSTTGYIAIALALYKIATPLRYTVTLGGSHVSINYLKKWGYIKPVPSKEELKEMYAAQKQIYNERKQAIKDNMAQTFKSSANE